MYAIRSYYGLRFVATEQPFFGGFAGRGDLDLNLRVVAERHIELLLKQGKVPFADEYPVDQDRGLPRRHGQQVVEFELGQEKVV